MVVSTPNKGVIVAEPPEPEEMDGLYEARCALEGKAAYLAAKNMTPARIERLESLILAMEAATDSPLDCMLRNREFHLALYEASGWKSALRIIGQLIDQTLVFWSQSSEWWTGDAAPFNEDHSEDTRSFEGERCRSREGTCHD